LQHAEGRLGAGVGAVGVGADAGQPALRERRHGRRRRRITAEIAYQLLARQIAAEGVADELEEVERFAGEAAEEAHAGGVFTTMIAFARSSPGTGSSSGPSGASWIMNGAGFGGSGTGLSGSANAVHASWIATRLPSPRSERTRPQVPRERICL